jgi:hypothetical protein
MEATSTFTLKRHHGEYESWPRESELLLYGNATGKSIPGYVLEAQYRCGSHYLFVTSWECLFEDSLEVVLTDECFDLVDRKAVGAMYTTTWLERHEVIAEYQLLLHCDNELKIRVTANGGVTLEQKLAGDSSYRPYPTDVAATRKPGATTWRKLW